MSSQGASPSRRSGTRLALILIPLGPRPCIPHIPSSRMLLPSPYGLDPVEAAVLIAVHSRYLASGVIPVWRTALIDYWIASRMRQDQWSVFLRQLDSDPERITSTRRRALVRLSQELLVSEVLTRVWTATAAIIPHPAQEEIELLSRSVYSGHLDARRRVLTRLLEACELGFERARRLDVLRRRCERWTDMLLGSLPNPLVTQEFSFDFGRVKEYHRTFFRTAVNARVAAETLYLCSVRQESGGIRTSAFPNRALNRRIIMDLIGCFGHDVVDAVAKQHDLWEHRMEQRTHELTSLVTHLIAN